MGDGVLVEFASAVNAVLCAAELQDRMAKANETEGHSQNIQLRIGINVGDVIVEGSDIYGDGVNIAARLEAIAEPGGILISSTVHDQVRSKVELSFVDLGPQTLKNISEPLRVFAVAGQRAAGLSGQAAATSSGIADSTKPSIAVLPFGDLGGNAGEAYFADGIIEEVILELSRFTELLVIARNSSFAFRGQNMDLRTIAQKLNVQYVVTGSLKRADKRIRLNVQLIEAATGANLWAERYDRQLTDIFDLQEELAHGPVYICMSWDSQDA
jgi:TolB-like protein